MGLKLGIIGMTEGNGHPYSWSAIFNGYDRETMTRECPFAGIPAYLNEQPENAFGIGDAKVVAVCCDQPDDARHVAGLSRIPEVVATPEEMLGRVDAVLIATDIGGEHVRRAKPFVAAGVPVFIDKPLCDDMESLAWFSQQAAAGAKILSSSSMRFAKELIPYHGMKTCEIGGLRSIQMTMPKKWETYGIHALEAIYPILGTGFVSITRTGHAYCLRHANGVEVVIVNVYDAAYAPILLFSGTKGAFEVRVLDTFTSFKAQLASFVDYLTTGRRPYPFAETEELMRLVIGGIASGRDGGREIILDGSARH